MLFLSLSEHYARLTRRDTDLVTYATGEIIAAPYSKTGSWCRARVLDSHVEDRIERSQVRVSAIFSRRYIA